MGFHVHFPGCGCERLNNDLHVVFLESRVELQSLGRVYSFDGLRLYTVAWWALPLPRDVLGHCHWAFYHCVDFVYSALILSTAVMACYVFICFRQARS